MESIAIIAIIIMIFLGLLLFFNLEHINVLEPPKTVMATAVLEGLINYKDESEAVLGVNLNDHFCNANANNLVELNTNCQGLPSATCKTNQCSVLVNGTTCMAGNQGGPSLNVDGEGNPIKVDYYYYMNKCYGNGCPQ